MCRYLTVYTIAYHFQEIQIDGIFLAFTGDSKEEQSFFSVSIQFSATVLRRHIPQIDYGL